MLTGVAKKKIAVWYAFMTRLGGGKKRKTRKKVKKAVVKELSKEKKLAIYGLVAHDMKKVNVIQSFASSKYQR